MGILSYPNGKKELFTDSSLFESFENCSFIHADPEPREKVILLDKPWNKSKGSGVYASVINDGGVYKLYYRGCLPEMLNDLDESQNYCYAESTDGINWTEPALGIWKYEGKDTNVIFTGHLAHNFSPFLDENPSCKPEERYKAVCGLGAFGGLFGFVSPDGLHWKELCDKPIVTDGAFDSHNVVFYDKLLKKYICYSRYFGKDSNGRDKRAIQSCVSDDFINWTPQKPNVYPDGTPEDQLYTNATVSVPGAEHIYIATPMRFAEERTKIIDDSYDPTHPSGVSDSLLMFSRDGVNWTIPDGRPFFRPGMDRRTWTQRNFISARGVIVKNGEISFYVCEHYDWEDAYIRRYTVPEDRLISVYGARNAGGRFTTKPFVFSGSVLLLNYRTSAVGTLCITLEAVDGSGSCTAELFGNSVSEPVDFGGSVSTLEGKPVRMTAALSDADIYGFSFK